MRWTQCRSKRGKFAGMCGNQMDVCCASPFPKEPPPPSAGVSASTPDKDDKDSGTEIATDSGEATQETGADDDDSGQV